MHPARVEEHQSTASASFSGALAAILFDTPATPDREMQEVQIVQRMESWLARADRKTIWSMALHIDESVIPLLSGKNLLRVARLLEDRAPTVIDSMSRLRQIKTHLKRSSALADVLSDAALQRLTKGILAARQDGSQQKGADH